MSEQITPNPSVPSQVVAEVKFPRFINNLGIIPTSYKDSMSYYECLAWLCKFLEETVIPSVNQNGEAVEELQALYVELNSYVTNYFDNLDVQEEINNKLDALVENGTLTDLISSYITPYTEKFVSKSNGDLEYMFTHHTTETGYQALCCDNDYYYYYEGNSNNLYKRSLSTNELINTYEIPTFLHGNDMTIINNIIYNANFSDKYINTFNLSNNATSTLDCLNAVSEYGIITGITKYDDDHLLVVMAPAGAGGSTRINQLGLFKVKISTDTYQAIELANDNSINLSSTSVIQSVEYYDGNLYFLTSQPSMITQFNEINSTKFNCVNIFDYHDYDVNGLPYGEMEGIALLPSWYNGKGTFLLFSQMNDFSDYKTLRFYCFNPLIRLPLCRIPIHQDVIDSSQLMILYVDKNATNYYEMGTQSYPFKDLSDAIHAYNYSNYLKYRHIQIVGAGDYTIKAIRNLKANIFSSIANVSISGPFSTALCDVHIEGTDANQITINISLGYNNASKIELINCNINYTPTAAFTNNNCKLTIWKSYVTTNGLFGIDSSIANLLFRSFTTSRQDGKKIAVYNNSFVCINNPSSVIPTDALSKEYSTVLRYNSVAWS